MKSIALGIFLILFSTSAFAWQDIASCNHYNFLIQRMMLKQGRVRNYVYQMTFKGGVLDFLLENQIVGRDDLTEDGGFVTHPDSPSNPADYPAVATVTDTFGNFTYIHVIMSANPSEMSRLEVTRPGFPLQTFQLLDCHLE